MSEQTPSRVFLPHSKEKVERFCQCNSKTCQPNQKATVKPPGSRQDTFCLFVLFFYFLKMFILYIYYILIAVSLPLLPVLSQPPRSTASPFLLQKKKGRPPMISTEHGISSYNKTGTNPHVKAGQSNLVGRKWS